MALTLDYMLYKQLDPLTQLIWILDLLIVF